MRVRLELWHPLLRRALTDLLESAGHTIAGESASGVELQILAEPGSGTPWPGPATLYLRPGFGLAIPRASPRDRSTSLRLAIATGGTVTWSGPLEPDALLDALAPHASERPSPEPSPEVDPFASAPDAWLLVEAVTRDVVWASPPARAWLDERDDGRLSARAAAAMPEAVFGGDYGHETRSVEGRPHLFVWWPQAATRRWVGILVAPAGASRTGENVETLAELGRISATLVHEIRNPLAAFAGALDLLAHEEDERERETTVELAQRRVEQMRSMLDDALRLARPFRSEPERVSAAEVVRSAVAAVRTDPLFERVELLIETKPGVRDVLAHPGPLQEAVLNLLVNAAQAERGTGRVTIRVEAGEDFGAIRVQDEGPGIPARLREQVFQPFWTTKEGGTGLGLTYVQRVAQAAGGRARVEDVASGACVCLELPFADRG